MIRLDLPRPSRTAPRRALGRRNAYAGAQMNRLTADWIFSPLRSATKEIQGDLANLRGRSRELARNTPTVRRYLRMCAENIVGPRGMRLQAQVKGADGRLATDTNNALEQSWRDFCRPGNASAHGRLSLHQLARLGVVLKKMDGEALFRIIRGVGPYGFVLQELDADQLDHTYNRPPAAGVNEIRQGVELDPFLRPVQYWVWNTHPDDYAMLRERVPIPADQIIHLFDLERAGQVRGVPATHAIMLAVKLLDGYTEAEVVAARSAAAKMGFFSRDKDAPGPGFDEDEDGDPLEMDAEPGLMQELPQGMQFHQWDPQHPVAAFGPFLKANQRLQATGLGVAYATLFNDLEAVNYSSGRLGLQSERDGWMLEQEDLATAFYERVYGEFLRMGQLAGAIPLPRRDWRSYADVHWQARRWPSVDPVKDATATAMELAMGLTTFHEQASERGVDFDEAIRTLADEYAAAKQLGVRLTLPSVTVDLTGDGRPDKPTADNPTDDATDEDEPGARRRQLRVANG